MPESLFLIPKTQFMTTLCDDDNWYNSKWNRQDRLIFILLIFIAHAQIRIR